MSDELSADQIRWLHERADERREIWRKHKEASMWTPKQSREFDEWIATEVQRTIAEFQQRIAAKRPDLSEGEINRIIEIALKETGHDGAD